MKRSIITGEKMVPVLYCDLDGTIRHGKDELGRFVNTADDVQVFEGVPGILHLYKSRGWRIIACSNQGGIALGHMSPEDNLAAMQETQKQTMHAFDKMLWCMHHPNATGPEMSVCWCRKPKPGLIIEGALTLSEKTGEIYPPHLALFVGDRPEDEQCAANAGIRFMDAKEWREVHLETMS